jgi:hypothetical protein
LLRERGAGLDGVAHVIDASGIADEEGVAVGRRTGDTHAAHHAPPMFSTMTFCPRTSPIVCTRRSRSALGHERRFRDFANESGLPSIPERSRHRGESTLRARAQLQKCAIRCNIKTFLHWKTLVSRIPFSSAHSPTTHEVICELASQEDARALNARAEAARVEDQFVRRTAIEVIGRHPQGRELRTIILSAFRDPSEYVVRTACEVVAQWELNDAHELVVALLANASKATRQIAIRTLGTIWVDADFPLIFRIYTNALEIDVRREAAWVLRRRVTSTHWRTLFDAFYVDKLPRHRQWACELAENFSGPDILPALSQLSLDVDGHVRKAASKAIRTLSRCE